MLIHFVGIDLISKVIVVSNHIFNLVWNLNRCYSAKSRWLTWTPSVGRGKNHSTRKTYCTVDLRWVTYWLIDNVVRGRIWGASIAFNQRKLWKMKDIEISPHNICRDWNTCNRYIWRKRYHHRIHCLRCWRTKCWRGLTGHHSRCSEVMILDKWFYLSLGARRAYFSEY